MFVYFGSVAVNRLSLVATNGVTLCCGVGLLGTGTPLISVRRLWSAGSAAALRELSRSGPAAYPRVGKEPRPLRWLGESQPPGHPGPLHAARCLYADASAGNRLFSSVGHAVCLSATPGTPARQASLSVINSRSSLKPMSIESVTPSNHVTLCRPLLLPPSVFPSTRVFSDESALCIRWPEYWSFSFSISPSSGHPGLVSLRMDWYCSIQ